MTHKSISMRMYRRILLLLAATGIAMGGILFFTAKREIDKAADRQLSNAASVLYMLMQDELKSGILLKHDLIHDTNDILLDDEDRLAFHASFQAYMFAVYWDGRLITTWNGESMKNLLPREEGFHDFIVQGSLWSSYGLAGQDGRLLIIVAERKDLRNIPVGAVARGLIIPLILLLLVSMAVLWLTLRRGVSQIERLAQVVNTRTLAELSPLNEAEWPCEMSPIIIALNKLFFRLDKAYELEQNFTDDVAHELRTPIAAIRAQAQLLRKTVPADLVQDAGKLIHVVDRATGLIDGLLTLARLDSTALHKRSIDIHALVADIAAEQLLNVSSDAIRFAVTPDHEILWESDEAILKIALSSLIENAIRHARQGRKIEVALRRKADCLTIEIGDYGPGIPIADRERLLRRFEKGILPTSGHGLGLSIAVRAIDLLGGSIILDSRTDESGLIVTVQLPAPRYSA